MADLGNPRRITLGPRADLIYGRSGSCKTTNVGKLAEYIFEKYGERTRLVTADPGGWQSIDHLVEAGLVEPFQLTQSHKYPLEMLLRLSQGWWPDASERLVNQPIAGTGVGAYAFEGMSTFSTLIMSNLVGRQDIHIPETPKESFVKDSEVRWGFSGRAHYGFIQQRIYEIVATSNHLPVHRILWTAHETETQEASGRKVCGPAIIGQAFTSQCGAWFGAMLHLFSTPREMEVDDPAVKGKKIKVLRRIPMMYLREHLDPDDPFRTAFLAKPRGPSSLWQEWPDVMEPDLSLFYKKLDDMGARAIAAVRSKQTAATGGTK